MIDNSGDTANYMGYDDEGNGSKQTLLWYAQFIEANPSILTNPRIAVYFHVVIMNATVNLSPTKIN